jgi:hypothetical protein
MNDVVINADETAFQIKDEDMPNIKGYPLAPRVLEELKKNSGKWYSVSIEMKYANGTWFIGSAEVDAI